MTKIPYEKWTYTHNEEDWPGEEFFDTEEQAVEAGKASAQKKGVRALWVGWAGKPEVPEISAQHLIEQLGEKMYDSEWGGDHAEDWPDHFLSKGGEEALEERVNRVISEVLEEEDALPHWFMAQDVRYVEVDLSGLFSPLLFRRKPAEVTAFRWTDELFEAVLDKIHTLPEGLSLDEQETDQGDCYPTGRLLVKTPFGLAVAVVGDWIIRGAEGELNICKPDVFDDVYEQDDRNFPPLHEIGLEVVHHGSITGRGVTMDCRVTVNELRLHDKGVEEKLSAFTFSGKNWVLLSLELVGSQTKKKGDKVVLVCREA